MFNKIFLKEDKIINENRGNITFKTKKESQT